MIRLAYLGEYLRGCLLQSCDCESLLIKRRLGVERNAPPNEEKGRD